MKKEVLFILLVLIVLTSILGISYASWLFTGKQKDFNTLGSKCFELTMINESEGITFDKAYPISDEEGLSTTGYTFTIKNTCNTYATYEVNLEDMLVEEKRLSGEYIKVSINDGTPMNLKELEEKEAHIEESDKSYELTSGSLGPEEEKTYTIKLWMDESTPAIEETMNATFLSKISIEAGYTPEENLENEITLQAKSITESLNNKSEVFEITGTSTNYNLIEYSLDKSHWSRIESPSKNVTITQEFTEEGKYTISVRDEVGNIKEIEVQTTKLDKTVPEIKIEETDNQENVELHITFTDNEGLGGYAITESSEEPTEWTNIEGKETTIEYTLTENTTYYIWVKDSVGNISYQKYSTDTIDTQAPELTITNTLTDWGVKDTITIKATDDVVGISGISISKVEETYNWEFVENTLSYETTKEVTENGTYYILVRDAYGHITTKSIVIDKIDDILPTIENLQTSTEWEKTNQITGSLKDPESGLSGYQITKEKIEPEEYIEINGTSYELNYEVSENRIYYIWVKDKAGNLYQTEIETNKIDVTAPVLSSITNSSNGSWAQSITLSWDIEENESGIAKVEYSTDNNIWNELSKEKWYGYSTEEEQDNTLYIRAIDNTGNISNAVSTTMKIDRTMPEAHLTGTTNSGTWTTSNNTLLVSPTPSTTKSGYTYTWYQVPEYKYTSSGFTVTEKTESDGSKYWNATYSKTSGTDNSWINMQFPSYAYTVGNTYKIHFKIRVNSVSNMSIGVRHSAISNDYGSDMKVQNFSSPTDGWVEGSITRVFKDSYKVGDVTYTTMSPRIEIYTSNLALTSGVTSRSIDFDFKDFWVEEIEQSSKSTIANNLAVKLSDTGTSKTLSSTMNNWYVVETRTGAGNAATSNKYNAKIDLNNPSASFSVNSSTAGSNGWYKALSVKATLSDSGSGVASAKYCTTTGSTCTPGTNATISNNSFTVTLGSNASAQKVCTQVTDKVGRTSGVICSSAYKVDTTNPSQSFSIGSSTSGSNGWYKALGVKVTLSDSHSGIASAKYCTTTGSTCTPGTNATISSNSFTVTLGSNASAQKVCAQTTDKSGRTSSVTCSSTYKVDTTDPTAKISASVKQNSIVVSASGSSDAHSGIANYQYSRDNKTWYTSTSNSYTFTGLSSGTYTVYVKVTDKSGRVSGAVSTKATVASDNIIYNNGTANYSYKKNNPAGGTITLASSYIYLQAEYNKTLSFSSAINNNYRYLKVTARASKVSSYGTYYVARFGVQSSPTSDSIGVANNILKNYDIILYSNSDKLGNVTNYTTFTLDLSSVTNSNYYVYLSNCDTSYYIQKVWLTNTA